MSFLRSQVFLSKYHSLKFHTPADEAVFSQFACPRNNLLILSHNIVFPLYQHSPKSRLPVFSLVNNNIPVYNGIYNSACHFHSRKRRIIRLHMQRINSMYRMILRINNTISASAPACRIPFCGYIPISLAAFVEVSSTNLQRLILPFATDSEKKTVPLVSKVGNPFGISGNNFYAQPFDQ